MIRKYRPDDVDALLDVWFAASSLAHPFLTLEFMEKERGNIRNIYLPNTKTWVFDDGDTVQGFISMIKNEVGAIFVRPGYQRQGMGKKLMDHVAQYYNVLEVEVFKNNVHGRQFYDGYGFTPLHEYLHEETGQMVIRMQCANPDGM